MLSQYSISFSENASGYLNITGSIPIFWGLKLKLIFGTGTGLSASQNLSSVTTKLFDIDGDGFPDQIIEFADGSVYYRRNMLGDSDLIKEIHLPQGGSCLLKYSNVPSTYYMPNSRVVLAEVTISDNVNKETEKKMPYTNIGNHTSTITYEYKNGAYNRYEYDFYGYGYVKSTNPDGSYIEKTYFNNTEQYSLKGYNLETKQYTGVNYKETENTDKLISTTVNTPVTEGVTNEVLTESVVTKYYEANSSEPIYTKTKFYYDNFLNINKVVDYYDINENDCLITRIDYLKDDEKHLYSLPISVKGYSYINGMESLLRKREGLYEDGSLKELYQYYDENSALKNTINYDVYGNIIEVIDSTGAKISISYDKDYHQYAEEISQSGIGTDTYTTNVYYNKLTQTKKKETDVNKLSMNYDYDLWQRPVAIYSPYDTTVPCVSYEYFAPEGKLWYAITNNKVVFDDDSNIIKTIILQDGLGRIIQTAKTGYVCTNSQNGVFEEGWNVSGAVLYDSKGRILEQGQPYFIPGNDIHIITNNDNYNLLFKNPVRYEYDYRDRVVKSILPDNSIVNNEYSIIYANDDERLKNIVTGYLLKTTNIDQNGNKTLQFTDSHGNIIAVVKTDSTDNLLTKTYYQYDMVGQMLHAFDSVGNPVSMTYDLLGRTLTLASLDSGERRFYYGASPNLLIEDDSRLRASNKNIVYEYDGLNRLIRIDHCLQEDTIFEYEDTIFEYGSSSEITNNLAGKLKSVKGEGTSISYKYGLLGEVVEETRTITSHTANIGQSNKSATMKYKSDYLGRIQEITYPDTEVVKYSYDYGGQVTGIRGYKNGTVFDYVKNIGYNEDGQRVFIEYGNDVKTFYTYDENRKWLSNIKTTSSNKLLLQNIIYEFDAVGNVTSYLNNCLDGGNYSTTQSYKYDSLYQLTSVTGNSIYNKYNSLVPTFQSEYTQNFVFDENGLGNMISKISSERILRGNKPDSNLNYDFDYVYQDGYAHRLERVGNRYFVYDENGNLIKEYDNNVLNDEPEMLFAVDLLTPENSETPVYGVEGAWGFDMNNKENQASKTGNSKFERIYEWDDKNQLIKTKDDLYTTFYVYNNDGDRVAKYTDKSETLYYSK